MTLCVYTLNEGKQSCYCDDTKFLHHMLLLCHSDKKDLKFCLEKTSTKTTIIQRPEEDIMY